MRNIPIAGVNGIPSGITAVIANVTAAETDNGGYLTVWPANQSKPPSSNLNWDPFRNTPNMVIVGVSPAGLIPHHRQSCTQADEHVRIRKQDEFGGRPDMLLPCAVTGDQRMRCAHREICRRFS